MPLEKVPVSINLAAGMDQKDDQKAGEQMTVYRLKDWIFNKYKRIDKRFGAPKLATTTVNAPAGTPAIGASAIKSSLFSHKDQLLLQNKGFLYSWLKDQSAWNYKGVFNPIEASSETLVSDAAQVTLCDAQSLNGVTVLAYYSSDAVGGSGVRYSVIEDSSGNYIIDNALVASSLMARVCVLKFTSAMVIVWQDLFNNIKSVTVSTTTGALGSINTLQTDSASVSCSWVVGNKAGVGERGYCAYYTGASQLKIFSITSAGTVDATMGSTSAAVAVSGLALDIHYNAGSTELFVAYGGSTQTLVRTYTLSSSSITLDSTITVATYEYVPTKFVMCDDIANSSQVYLFYQVDLANTYARSFVNDHKIYKAVLSHNAVVTAESVVGIGLEIAARPISESIRGTIYLPCGSTTDLQASNFLVDVLKGKSEAAFQVTAKWNSGTYGGAGFSVIADSATQYRVCHMVRTRIIVTPTVTGNGIYKAAAAISTIDLAPQRAASRQFISNATLLSGGHIGYYDGSSISENSYFLNPENIEVVVASTLARVALSIVTPGDTFVKQKVRVTCLNGPLQLTGSLGARYWTFSTTAFKYYVWYTVNGVGSSPSLGWTPIQVALTGNETSEEVALKTRIAIVNSGAAVTCTRISGGVFDIEGTVNGTADAPDATAYVATANTLAAGDYQWSAVWSWYDASGQLVRSAPSVAITKTLSTTSDVGVVVQASPITNRNATDVRVEFYRTEKNATTLKKLFQDTSQSSWLTTAYSVGCRGDTPDIFIASNEQIYTTGGVLDNSGLEAVKNLSIFKNRLVASGIVDNEAQYSKTAVTGSPLELSDELFLTLDNDGLEIKGHAQMDDKLIFFKDNRLTYIVGDGANDLGQNVSFSQPINTPSDVGAIDHNSIVLTPDGLMFKSRKGIFLLSRSLQIGYLGIAVEDFNQYTVSRAIISPDENQALFFLSDADYCLVYDFVFKQWCYFSQYGADDACVWDNKVARVLNDGSVAVEDTSVFVDTGFATPSYSPQVETKWLKAKNVQDIQRVYRAMLLGELKSRHTMTAKVYYDYDESQFDTYTIDSNTIAAQIPYQIEMGLARQKCEAIKFVFTFTPNGGTEECLTLTDLALLVGVKRGLNKLAASKKI
jgi:hypothetical protein